MQSESLLNEFTSEAAMFVFSFIVLQVLLMLREFDSDAEFNINTLMVAFSTRT